MSLWDSKSGGEVDSSDAKKKALRKAAPLTTVLFVEQNPGGMYAAKLRETEEKLAANFRVKVLEKSGTTLRSMLVRSDPWAGESEGGRDAHFGGSLHQEEGGGSHPQQEGSF